MPKKLIIQDSRGNAYDASMLEKIGNRSRATILRLMNQVVSGSLLVDDLIAKLRKNKKFVRININDLVFIGKKNPETGKRIEYTVEFIMEKTGVVRETAIRRIKKALKDPSKESGLLREATIGQDAIDMRTTELTEEQLPIWKEMQRVTESCRDAHDRYYKPIDYTQRKRATMNTKRR